MPDQNIRNNSDVLSNCFKEAVCINTERIYDSAADKDCLEDLRVHFTECEQRLVDKANSVRVRDAKVLFVYIDVEPIPFDEGFFTVDITYFFEVKVELFENPLGQPKCVKGIATFNKVAILFGSEGNVKTFTSDEVVNRDDYQERPSSNLPKAVVQIAEPVVLGAKICDVCDCRNEPCCCCCVPNCVKSRFDGEVLGASDENAEKAVYITLGIFSIIQLGRDVQLLIPIFDFCIPERGSVNAASDPCDLFSQIEFPKDDFFPPRARDLLGDRDRNNDCGCCNR